MAVRSEAVSGATSSSIALDRSEFRDDDRQGTSLR
jgi:hypothetical protein